MGLLDLLQQDPEKREALRQGLLNAGIQMLAGGRQDFGTSLGQGLGAGVGAYQKLLDDMKMKQARQQAIQAATTQARPAVPEQFGVNGQRFPTREAAQSAANPYKTYGPQPGQEALMPNMNAIMTGNAPPENQMMSPQQEVAMPEQQVETLPGQEAQAGGFDFGKYAQAAIANPDSPDREQAMRYLANQQAPEAVKPQLVTVYENGQPVQKWLRPGEAEGVQVGAGKPEADSYKERTVSPDGQTYVKQYSQDGGKTWRQIEGTQPYDIRAAAGSSNVTVNGFPKETFKNERDLRNDFQGLPTVKAYKEVQNSYDQINFALKNPSAANDLVAATKFMKMLDPGSVVRESELGMAMAATGQIDRMSNYYNMLKTGQKLTPVQREDFHKSAQGLYQAATGRYNQSANEYRTMAQDYQLNPDRIAKPAASEKDEKPAAKPAAKAQSFALPPNAKQYEGKTIKDTKTGKRFQAKGGKWVEIK